MTQYGLPIVPYRGLSGAATPAPNPSSNRIQYCFGGVKETGGKRPAQEAL